MNLQEFINKNKETAKQFLNCGGCGNELIHCGKYTIEKVGMGKGKKSEEGLLCETCKQNGRQLINAIKISDDNNHLFRFALADLQGVEEGQEPGIVELTPPIAAAPATTNNNNNKNNAVLQQQKKEEEEATKK